MSDLGNLLQMIYDLLSGWLSSFASYATDVMEKLNLIEDDTDTIVSNTSDIADDTNDIKDNTGAIVTPVQSIKTNTDSIKNDTTNIKNNVSTMTNQLGTISTNVGTASAFTEDVANNTLDIKDKVVTIASDTTQIRSNTNTVVTDMDKVYEALKWALVDKVTTETEEGTDTVSFDTDLTEDLVKLDVGIVCTQPGTGDPSPDNNRPFLGYSNATLNINGNNFIIALGQTIYGAILNAIEGLLKVNKELFTFSGSENWVRYSGTTPFWYYAGAFSNFKDYTIQSSNGIAVRLAGTNIIRVYNQPGIDENTNMNNIFKSGTQLLSDCFVPIEITLTPAQIETIKGINTISTDTNGIVEVTYKESVKHYLDKQEA